MPEYDIFLSHANLDKPLVNEIYKDLLSQDFVVWYDKDNIHGGNQWTKALEEGIDNSKVLLVIWTENSSKSDWVDKEITRALSKRMPVVPLVMDDTELSISLGNLQSFNTRQGYHSVFPKLVSRINTFAQIEVSEKNSKNFAWSYQKKPSWRSEFLELNNYVNKRDSNFALNEWTSKLNSFKGSNWVNAESFVSFCVIPYPNIIDVNLNHVRDILQSYDDLKLETPSRQFKHRIVTISERSDGELIFYENRREATGIEPYTYLRFSGNGDFEFANSYNTVFDFEDRNGEVKKGFELIKILGASWKILNFIAYYYQQSEYLEHFQFLVNLRNTNSKMLAGFASEGRHGWQSGLSHDPFNRYRFKANGISSSENLQFVYNVSTEGIIENPELTHDIMIHLSNKIQWAFNLKYEPRHCMPDSTDFHWSSYDSYHNEFI